MKTNSLGKISAYIKRYGVKKLLGKAVERCNSESDYNNERLNEIISEEEIIRQSNAGFEYEPVISIIMPAYNTPAKAFTQTLLSVKNQTYGKWELCIADGGDKPVESIVGKVFGSDERIRYKSLEQNLGISGNSNEALALASGDYVAFLDHDDILEPDALFETVSMIVEKGADMVYTDEDKVSENLEKYFRPFRKPDYNRALFLSNNYICHFCVIRKSIVDEIGGFREGYDGAQDYDLFLRAVPKADKIEHVCKILYHWRVGEQSTSDNPFNKEYAFIAGRKALQDYFDREGILASVKETEDPGYFRTEYTGDLDINIAVVTRKDIDSIEKQKADYYMILEDDMSISPGQMKELLGSAVLHGADVVVPKIIKNHRYLYNGIAKRGNGHTQSLKGKPMWYRGRFNLGITDMDVNVAPLAGILVKKEALPKVLSVTEGHLNNLKGECTGLKMLYAPQTVIAVR
ncbi:MAG: glycosyltransferase [Butyrivibrio sp.]